MIDTKNVHHISKILLYRLGKILENKNDYFRAKYRIFELLEISRIWKVLT